MQYIIKYIDNTIVLYGSQCLVSDETFTYVRDFNAPPFSKLTNKRDVNKV